MSSKERALYIVSFILFAVAVYAYTSESRSTGLLPIVIYPYRAYSIFIVVCGIVVLVSALTVRKLQLKCGNKTKEPLDGRRSHWTFALAFLFFGFVMKLVGEAVHELLGHGFFVLPLGGQVTGVHISPLWPYEFSYIGWDASNTTSFEITLIIAGGILASAVVTYSLQILFPWRSVGWKLSLPLFWLSFWRCVNATRYLVAGSLSPFGDIEELIGVEY